MGGGEGGITLGSRSLDSGGAGSGRVAVGASAGGKDCSADWRRRRHSTMDGTPAGLAELLPEIDSGTTIRIWTSSGCRRGLLVHAVALQPGQLKDATGTMAGMDSDPKRGLHRPTRRCFPRNDVLPRRGLAGIILAQLEHAVFEPLTGCGEPVSP